MGYNTGHNLKIYKNNSEKNYKEVLSETLEILEQLGVINYALDKELNLYEWVTWYKHREDMKRLSSIIENVVFELSGEGDDAGDIWKEYYLNGKIQICEAKITFDEFDENKLSD